jgi:hypothetical protein
MPLPERIQAKIAIVDDSPCWIWTGSVLKVGYGNVGYKGKVRLAHRVVYELLVGPIPEGMTLDHLCHTADASCRGGRTCRHRRCVNPAHLEVVTKRVNFLRGRSFAADYARQTHCSRGHEFDKIKVDHKGRASRQCTICQNAAKAHWRENNLEAARKATRECQRRRRAKVPNAD